MSLPDPTPTEATLSVRPFQNADAPAVARLVTAGMRGHWTYTVEQFRESADPGRVRLVAVNGDEVVATLHLSPFGSAASDALRPDLAGDPTTFTALYLAALARLPNGFSRLLGVTREDWPETMGFFHAAGSRNAWQSWGAHLDLTRFDPAPFAALEERLFLAGYEVERLGENAPEGDWAALHALHTLGIENAPRHPTTTPDPLTLAELREMVVREEVAFVVRLRGEIVASTRLTPQGREVEIEHTVTARDHRGRGLATVLGAHALGWASEEGYARASTGGAVLNLPMLRVNSRLGYVPEAMWVTWERRL
ncbi:GNAT family N-acetyltransferase [Deinococcus sp. YIM 134068]|uniref:GNAT family N-acetyltransferase n=1 Tax=Deinococcus lichenicola TaxID=3118910 RepID=UPI002F9286C9